LRDLIGPGKKKMPVVAARKLRAWLSPVVSIYFSADIEKDVCNDLYVKMAFLRRFSAFK